MKSINMKTTNQPMQNKRTHYTVETVADSSEAISFGLYLDFNQHEQTFDYCGAYDGLMLALQTLRDNGSEFSHRISRVESTSKALGESTESTPRVYPKTSYSLHNVWGAA